jgi:hypothetical protein
MMTLKEQAHHDNSSTIKTETFSDINLATAVV